MVVLIKWGFLVSSKWALRDRAKHWSGLSSSRGLLLGTHISNATLSDERECKEQQPAFEKGNYNKSLSVTSMLNKLGLCTLEERRKRSRLSSMYKIIHGLVDIKKNDFFKI